MRWDELFADLEAQLEAGLGAEERERELEEERLRVGRLTLRDRIAGFGAEGVALQLTTGERIRMRARTLGRDWIAGDLDGDQQAVLPLHAVAALLLPPDAVDRSLRPPPAGALTDRLGLAFMLRDLARRRRGVEVMTRNGTWPGTFDRVGRDHADLAVHPLGTWRRAGEVTALRVLPLVDIVLVRV